MVDSGTSEKSWHGPLERGRPLPGVRFEPYTVQIPPVHLWLLKLWDENFGHSFDTVSEQFAPRVPIVRPVFDYLARVVVPKFFR